MRFFPLKILLVLSFSILIAGESHDLELARRFLVLEKYDKAAEVLERALAQNPDDPEVQNMLLQVYRGQKKYDKLEGALQSMLLRNPKNSLLWAELGAVYLAQNKPEDAQSAFDKATKIDPNNPQLAKQIHEALSQRGFIDEDIKFIQKSRKRIGDRQLLAIELARLHEIKGRFDDAVSEYANYLKKYPDRFGDVERKIDIGGRSPEELLQLRKSLDELLKTDIPKWQPFRLISIVELKLGNLDKSFDAIKKADGLQSKKYRGGLMTSFVEDMLRLQNFDYARKGARYLVDNTGENYVQTGRLYLAKALRGLGKYDEAIAQLDSIEDVEDKTPTVDNKNVFPQFKPPSRHRNIAIIEDAAVLKARIFLENFRNPDEAESAIEPLCKGSRWMKNEEAVKIKGEIFIYKKRFREGIVFLTSAFQMKPQSEPVAYLLAMTFFFAGIDDTALVALHNVVGRFPKSDMGNEAVELILVMQTQKEQIEKIREPVYLMFVHDTANALKKWQGILSGEKSSAFSDYVMWKIGDCQSTLRDSSAYTTMRNLVDKFPKSFYAPLALEILADKKVADGDKPAATELYVKIVNDYPDAVNMEIVRDKLKSLGGNL